MKFNNTGKCPRIRLGAVGDDYVLGVICQKCGLVEYAKMMLGGLTTNASRAELFLLGRREAKDYEFKDIAYDLWKIRRKCPKDFELVLGELIPHNLYQRVMFAIMTVTPESIERDRKLNKRFLELFKARIKAEEKGRTE